MPDSSGFGSYTESGMVIPCRLQGEDMNFVAQMYLDDDPPIAAGREIWGFPKKYVHRTDREADRLLVDKRKVDEVLERLLERRRAIEARRGARACRRATAMLSKTQVNLKLIPGVDGKPGICQLVAYNLTEIIVKGSWIGPGRLHLVPHVNAPVADLPVRRIIGAHHFIADLTLPYGRVLHDYLGSR